MSLNVRLFGDLVIYRDAQVQVRVDARKVLELLCYLLIYRQRPHTRESLAALLWGDSTTSQSLKYLRQALWKLRSTPGIACDGTGQPLLLLEADKVQVNCEAVCSDVAEFEAAHMAAQGLIGAEMDEEGASALRKAVDLYRGDLLEGWSQDWCLFERGRYQGMYLSLLDKLMAYCEAHQCYEAGLDYGARALRCEPIRERTHRRLMRLHYLMGDRTAALRQYQSCATILRDELGVAPDQQTRLLHDDIQYGLSEADGTLVREPAGVVARLEMDTRALREILEHLNLVQAFLANMQHHGFASVQLAEVENMP